MIENSQEYNWRPFKQGTDWTRTLEFTTAGTAIDLSNYTAYMTVRDEPHEGGNILYNLTSTTGPNGSQITITGAQGLVTLFIAHEDTEAFTWKKGYYDLKLESSGGMKYVPIFGEMTVLPLITEGST